MDDQMLAIEQDDELFVGDTILKEYGDCMDCGLCCRFFNSISIYPEEIIRASTILSMDEEQFKQYYTKKGKHDEISLKTPCPFLHQNKCQIYPHRFFTCKTYPFCINLSKNKGILSGIYLCPKSTQFYEGMLQYYSKYDLEAYQKIILLEEKTNIDEKGMKIIGASSLFSPYLDWLISNEQQNKVKDEGNEPGNTEKDSRTNL
jgi:Fe-S-cluster containining protein